MALPPCEFNEFCQRPAKSRKSCGEAFARGHSFSRNRPEDSTPWAKELRSPTSHSNRSLRTEVSVAGKRNFQGRDKEAETALEIQERRCRDKISLGNPANSGLVAGFGEISVGTRMRGGAERTRTACQARSRYRTGLSRVISPRQFCDQMSPSRATTSSRKDWHSGAIGASSSCARVGLRRSSCLRPLRHVLDPG